MNSTQFNCIQAQKTALQPVTQTCTTDNNRSKTPYCKPNLQPLGHLNQIVRGSSAKGVDCAGELDLATYPF